MKAAPGQKVFVYWNIRKKLFSVVDYKTRRLIQHTDSIKLKDAVFKVSEVRRRRVIRTKCKNVHAGVVGLVTNMAAVFLHAYYNPYVNETFVNARGEALHTADKVSLRVTNNSAVVLYH